MLPYYSPFGLFIHLPDPAHSSSYEAIQMLEDSFFISRLIFPLNVSDQTLLAIYMMTRI